ncbi:CPA2 [Branchiostoma lanceolatum]|nr:CPA2 [Branchiostoma lanceolatum]
MKVLLLWLTIAVASAMNITRFDGEQVLRVIPQDEHQLQQLTKLEATDFELDFWKRPSGLFHPVDVRVPKDRLTYFKKLFGNTGMNHTVMIDDLQQLINSQTSTSSVNGEFDFNKYNRISAINAQLDKFARTYPDRASVFTIGQSYEGRVIKGIKVGIPGYNKPAVVLEGTIHAREWIVAATLLYNIKFLLEGYDSDSKITEVMNKVDFYFIPVTNPDGYEYTHTNNRMWRKTRSRTSWCIGVDPNRNFDDHFGGAGTSRNPCSDIYHGPHAFSEVETKAVSNWVLAKKAHIKAYLAVHSYSQLWMTPYGWTSKLPRDYSAQLGLARRATQAIRRVYGTYFKSGSIANTIYAASGSSCDWAYEKAKIKYSYAIELRDKGWYGFILPANQIKPSAKEFFAGLLVVAEQVAKE